MKAVQITEKVWWVGAIDWNLREFHGYRTARGTTYNAYLVLADKITLVDTVKAPFREEMMQRVASVIGDPAKIDYIVSNHAEMDHSGALPEVIAAVKPEKVFASPMGVKALDAHFRLGPALTPVKTGEVISLGNMSMTFVETRMLHWPDSMISYIPEQKILFSQDGFGMHLATDKLFADENDPAVVEQEMRKYYANILLLYAPQTLKLLDDLPKLDLAVDVIAPDHGPVWRGALLGRPMEYYAKWSAQKPEKRAAVVYSTMWHSTEKMAVAIADGIRSTGVRVKLMSLEAHTRSEVATEVMCAGALVVGSPTLNNQMYPAVADVLCYLKGLRPKNVLAAGFGSFGWSGEAVAQIYELFAAMKLESAAEGLKIKYVPTDADLKNCFDYGVKIGEKIAGN
ncbi:MAG: FprA family A-type flavoprotein [Lentisphaeria bacterium]|nr:FprA family A-type flavoprotein [Lentisphaeria bacterium]